MKLPDKVKVYSGYAFILLGFLPQILFAIGKPELAIPLQDILGIVGGVFNNGQPVPAIGQGALVTVGARFLRSAKPKES